MINRYLLYFFSILSIQNTYGVNNILTPISSQQPHPLITNKFPKRFSLEHCIVKEYENMASGLKSIVRHLDLKNAKNANFFNYNTNKIKNSNYFVIRIKREESDISKYFYYIFEWIKKPYNNLKGLEKDIVDYYRGNKNSDIKFLYPYKRTDKTNDHKIANSPWAIMMNSQIYAILWKQASLENSDYSTHDSFTTIKIKDLNKSISLLVDENDKIIAKKIGDTITFRQN